MLYIKRAQIFITIVTIILLTNVITSVIAINGDDALNNNKISLSYKTQYLVAPEVWVDDDYYNGGYNDGHIWGYDAFDNIQNGIDNVTDNGVIHVKAGIYSTFKIINRNGLLVEGFNGVVPISRGYQIAWDIAAAQNIRVIILINNSKDIVLTGFEFQGVDLSGRSVGVFFQISSGEISNSIVTPNQKGNMYNLAVRAHLHSIVTITNCTIKNYGRIGIYCRDGTTLTIEHNTIIGQIYTASDGDYVSYGIEIEALNAASHAQIRYNEIYSHDHTGTPSWSSAAIIIDSWRYYQESMENCTAVIEFNNLHNNMIGVQIVPNEYVHLNYNIIRDNSDFGAVSDPYLDGGIYRYYDLDARYNWWGDSTGPYEPTINPNGLGNEVTDYVEFEPWAQSINPTPHFVSPLEGFLYLNLLDTIELKIPFITTFIIGKSTIEIDTPRCLYGIDYVEFYIDDEIKHTDYTDPYSWEWDEKTQLYMYWIEAIVYDTHGNSGSVRMKSWKVQMRSN